MSDEPRTTGNPEVTSPEIIDRPAERRLVARIGNSEAELVYRVVGGQLVILHTGVPEELAGGGLGGKLVAAALQKADQEGLVVVTLCPFATAWLRRHPDEAAEVTIDWSKGR